MNKNQLIPVAVAVLLSASGLAVAKGGAPAISGGSGNAARAATHVPTNSSNTKPDTRSSKGNVNASTPADGARDPYSVPLFKDARPLR